MTAVGDDVRSGNGGEVPSTGTEGFAEEARASEPPAAPQLADVVAELALLRQATERYQERAAARERVIDQLSAEVERLRLGDRRSVLRPVLVELCRLRDDLLKQAGSLPETFSVDQARGLLRSYADTVELELETQGVTPFAVEVGAPFDPRRHSRVSAVPTGVEAEHGTVAATERSGYTDLETERVLQQAGVLVHAYQPPAEPSPDPVRIPAPFATTSIAMAAQETEPADPARRPADQTRGQP